MVLCSVSRSFVHCLLVVVFVTCVPSERVQGKLFSEVISFIYKHILSSYLPNILRCLTLGFVKIVYNLTT